MDKIGMVHFDASDAQLRAGFAWAKEQALVYAHGGEDAVGLWYEAALPGRDAFCIRDTAHQRAGAAVLGLAAHTRNMLEQFAQSISASRDYCMYWEIEKSGRPAPVDYKNDRDFWYNLPANFDMLCACYLEALWTGDESYRTNESLTAFYRQTLHEYIAAWDKDGDGFPEHYRKYGRRGIASYNEQGFKPFLAGDLIAAQWAAFEAGAALSADAEMAALYRERAKEIRAHYLREWYDTARERFFGAMKKKDKFFPDYYREGNFLPICFGIFEGTPHLQRELARVKANGADNVEAKSYFPQLYYENGLWQEGYHELCELCKADLPRREYPEISFAVAGAVVNQYMGIAVQKPGEIRTLFRSCNDDDWADLRDLPVLGGEIAVRHEGRTRTELTRIGGKAIRWKVCFQGDYKTILVNGERKESERGTDAAGGVFRCCTVEVHENEIITAQAE